MGSRWRIGRWSRSGKSDARRIVEMLAAHGYEALPAAILRELKLQFIAHE
jgi:hypothetical protein